MLKNQLIAFLFASVLLANLGHNIVPHHHHIDNIHSCHGCHDHNAINNAIHIGDPGSFCHAFNGLEYFPGPQKHKLNKPEKLVPGVFLPNVILSEQVFPFQKSFLESRGSPPVLPDLLGTSSGLRAPPYLS